MNLVVLTGRLTKETELKKTEGGKKYYKFTLAVPREFNKDEVDFVNCTAWNKDAKYISEYVKKGDMIGIQGELRVNAIEVDGSKKTFTEVNLNKVEILNSNRA